MRTLRTKTFSLNGLGTTVNDPHSPSAHRLGNRLRPGYVTHHGDLLCDSEKHAPGLVRGVLVPPNCHPNRARPGNTLATAGTLCDRQIRSNRAFLTRVTNASQTSLPRKPAQRPWPAFAGATCRHSLPLDGSWRFTADVVADPVDALHFVDDAC